MWDVIQKVASDVKKTPVEWHTLAKIRSGKSKKPKSLMWPFLITKGWLEGGVVLKKKKKKKDTTTDND